jgi:hypothetical protein
MLQLPSVSFSLLGTFESFSSKVVGQPLEGILGIWRNLWEDGLDLATHVKAYTEVQLKSARESAANRERYPHGEDRLPWLMRVGDLSDARTSAVKIKVRLDGDHHRR